MSEELAASTFWQVSYEYTICTFWYWNYVSMRRVQERAELRYVAIVARTETTLLDLVVTPQAYFVNMHM